MKNSLPKNTMPQPDLANLDHSELVSNEEAKVVPWFTGQRKFAVTWISPVYNLKVKNAPSQGKK